MATSQLTDYLPAEKIQEYLSQGHSEAEIWETLKEVIREKEQPSALQQSYNRATTSVMQNPMSSASNTIVSGQIQSNLVQWQLELDSILERIEHMLRGDKPQFIGGSLIFVPPKTNKERIMTDFGVAEVMRILSMYLNRNTILSNYDEETINWKVLDFGINLSDLIYLKYEQMFASETFAECYNDLFGKMQGELDDSNIMELENKDTGIIEYGIVSAKDGKPFFVQIKDNMVSQILRRMERQKLEKRKLYPMLVGEIVDSVHSAYLRALNGGERESLREARNVQQSESINPNGMVTINNGQQMKERSILNPFRYLRGKYK